MKVKELKKKNPLTKKKKKRWYGYINTNIKLLSQVILKLRWITRNKEKIFNKKINSRWLYCYTYKYCDHYAEHQKLT